MSVPTAAPPLNRILIYGVTGSGKTTLAAQLSAATGLPWHSVDDLTWEPGWVAVPFDEQRRRMETICAGERWILDTAYGQWRDVPLARAEVIVALDYPRWVSLGRLLRRTLGRAIDHRPICNGNVESWRLMLSRESILVWHFRSFRSKQQRIRAWADDPLGPRVLQFKSPRQTKAWLGSLDAAGRLCGESGAGRAPHGGFSRHRWRRHSA